MEMKDFAELLELHLDPVNKAITELKESHKDIVNILINQSRQDESIKHLRDDINICVKDRDEIFTRLRAHEQDGGDKMWDIIKLFIAGAGGGILAFLGLKGVKL